MTLEEIFYLAVLEVQILAILWFVYKWKFEARK